MGKKVAGGGTSGRSFPTSWEPPAAGYFKVNVDTGLLGDVGSGLGVVIRNSKGELVECAAIQCLEKWETSVAEAKVIYWGLKVALEHLEAGLSQVVVESNSLLVVQALKNNTSGRVGACPF